MLIQFDKGLVDVECIEQSTSFAFFFADNGVCTTQCLDGTKGDVISIADGGRYD
jgi:hypothetical protein